MPLDATATDPYLDTAAGNLRVTSIPALADTDGDPAHLATTFPAGSLAEGDYDVWLRADDLSPRQAQAYVGWGLVAEFLAHEIMRQVGTIRYYSIVIAGVTVFLAFLASVFFTSSIARPVIALRALMKKAEAGDLGVRFEGPQDDEIGHLGKSFNTMIEEVQKLIRLVYQEQQAKREAELRTLQEQIKPHFLYNTLDTIQWMAQSHGAEWEERPGARPLWSRRERGGYWRHYDGPHYSGRGPKNYQRSDDRVREEICDTMTDDPPLDASDITVQVEHGEVTLSGTVASREQKRRAEDVAERVSGVKDVTNQLRVSREANGHTQTASQPVTQASGQGTPSKSASGTSA